MDKFTESIVEDVEYQADGRLVHDKVWLVDFADPDNNDWLASNQFTVIEGKHNRHPNVWLIMDVQLPRGNREGLRNSKDGGDQDGVNSCGNV